MTAAHFFPNWAADSVTAAEIPSFAAAAAATVPLTENFAVVAAVIPAVVVPVAASVMSAVPVPVAAETISAPAAIVFVTGNFAVAEAEDFAAASCSGKPLLLQAVFHSIYRILP